MVGDGKWRPRREYLELLNGLVGSERARQGRKGRAREWAWEILDVGMARERAKGCQKILSQYAESERDD